MLTRNHLECLSALTAESLKWGLGFRIFTSSTRHPMCTVQFSSVAQSCRLFATPWIAARQASLSIIQVYSNSCPLSWWCHPAISSSVVPFSSCPQSLPESGSFRMSQLFAWGGQSIGVSASASSALPMNTQDWSKTYYVLFACMLCIIFFLPFPLLFLFIFIQVSSFLYWLLLTWVFLFFILSFNEAT